MKVVIVGGGIGGFALAAELERVGIDWTLLEKAPARTEVGAGLQISPNATKVLARLGLEPALDSCGVRAEEIRFNDLETGAPISATPLGERAAAEYGATFYQVHRADLLDLLVAAVPAGKVRTGAQVCDVHQFEDGVEVRLADGQVVTGDVVVGADGIHSTVRDLLHGPGEPEFSGIVGWRALIPRDKVAGTGLGRASNGFLGRGRSCVFYWVRGAELLNVVALIPSAEARRESWTDLGDTADLRRSFDDACGTVRAVLERVEDDSFLTGVYSRAPLPHWTSGRITLLGDAAHPMQPYLAQGACQSLEDAAVLADRLAAIPDDPATALADYESRRRPRATKVQVVASASALFWNESDPVQTRARNGRFAGLARIDPLSTTTWGWLYRHDPTDPDSSVVGVETADATVRMQRPESQRAFTMWRGALQPHHHAGGWRGVRRGYDEFLLGAFPVHPAVLVEEVDADGVRCLAVTPPDADPEGPLVVHLHGGGYVVGSADSGVEPAARLAAACGGTALVVDYRLAPEHAYPAALDDAVRAFRWAARSRDPASILVSGESAGGGLAAAMLLSLRDADAPLPAGAYLMSPFADMTVSGASVDDSHGRDPVADRDLLTGMAASYLQDADPQDPYLSPIFGDFRGCPPVLLHAAEPEALFDDARRLAARIRETGGDVRTRWFPDTVHIFPLFAFLPETDEALSQLGTFAAAMTRNAATVGPRQTEFSIPST